MAAECPPIVGVALAKAAPFFQKGEYAKAGDILQATLAKGAEHKELYRMLGNCAFSRGKIAKAEEHYRAGLKLDDKDVGLWLNLGKVQYELKRYNEAAHSFRAAWDNGEKDKRKGSPLYYSAGAWLMAKKSDKAIATFDTLFAAYPEKEIKTEWREQYIHALVEDGQVKKALPLIRQMIAVSEGRKKEQWQEILLGQYVDLKMYPQATDLARSLTDEYPENAKWWKALCHVQLAREKMEDALAALIVYSYLKKPLSGSEKSLLADLYLEVGTPVKAAPLYRDVLQEKYRKDVLQRLVLCLYRQDDIDSALTVLKHYKKEVAQSSALLQQEGEIYYDRKEFSSAAQAYSKAAGIKGRHQGPCWLMAGYSALQGDDFSGAKRYLQKAMKYAKQKKSAAGALKMVQARLAEKL